jgi:hypothetical protein
MKSHGGTILAGENWKTRRKTSPSLTMSTTKPAWTDMGTNLSLRRGWPAINPLINHSSFEAAKLLAALFTEPQITDYVTREYRIIQEE